MTGNKEDDRRLLNEIAKGSTEAFDRLYLRYFSLVESFSYALLKDRQEANDLCQSVFLKLWENREHLPEIDSFNSYLFIMTRNSVFKVISRRRHVYMCEDSLPDTFLEGLPIEDIENRIVQRDLIQLVGMAVETMPEQRRKVFNMSRKDGMSHKEIADSLGLSVKTVDYHISKALAELREIIKIIILFI